MLYRINSFPLHRIPEEIAESGPDKAVQERGGEVGLEEHPVEEVQGQGVLEEEDIKVGEVD